VRRLGVLELRAPDGARLRTKLITELRDGGFDIAALLHPAPVASFPIAAVLVLVDASGADAMGVWVPALVARSVTVVVVFDERAPELRLRAAIEGAVACLPSAADGRVIATAVKAALAEDAPSFGEQRRRSRVSALEALVRGGVERQPERERVHLTRLEHGPVREEVPAPAAPFAACTDKQRELLGIVAREGSVGRAAIVTGTSRSALYSNLRRIAHRLNLRDSGELLRLLGATASDPPVHAS